MTDAVMRDPHIQLIFWYIYSYICILIEFVLHDVATDDGEVHWKTNWTNKSDDDDEEDDENENLHKYWIEKNTSRLVE